VKVQGASTDQKVLAEGTGIHRLHFSWLFYRVTRLGAKQEVACAFSAAKQRIVKWEGVNPLHRLAVFPAPDILAVILRAKPSQVA
jgi:hypothetical protein